MLKIISPNGTACLYLKSAQDYLQNGGDVANYYKGNLIEPNQAIPVCIGWHTDKEAKSFTIKYSHSPTLKNCETVAVDGNINEINVFNLLKATTYYVEIIAHYIDNSVEKASLSFTTAEKGPRPLQIDGIYNTRDVGGYLLSNGKRTKQNKLFRGGLLSPCKDYESVGLTESGKTYMSEILGIKTEIEFRPPEESESGDDSAIPNAKLLYALIHGYDAIINYAEGYKTLFSILANESNYPIYMHCTGGADRTGTACFLINAVLGVDEKTLIEDYEFTTFSYFATRSTASGWTQPLWEKFINLINSFKGETLNDRVENLLLSIGVTKEQILSIRRIMID